MSEVELLRVETSNSVVLAWGVINGSAAESSEDYSCNYATDAESDVSCVLGVEESTEATRRYSKRVVTLLWLACMITLPRVRITCVTSVVFGRRLCPW